MQHALFLTLHPFPSVSLSMAKSPAPSHRGNVTSSRIELYCCSSIERQQQEGIGRLHQIFIGLKSKKEGSPIGEARTFQTPSSELQVPVSFCRAKEHLLHHHHFHHHRRCVTRLPLRSACEHQFLPHLTSPHLAVAGRSRTILLPRGSFPLAARAVQ